MTYELAYLAAQRKALAGVLLSLGLLLSGL